MPSPRRRRIVTPRPLTAREELWIREILEHNPRWADVDLMDTRVVAECDCGNCGSVYLESSAAQNPGLVGTKGYVGRIEIRTIDDFGITITLDQKDGRLSELHVNPIDLREPGDRALPDEWREKGHVVKPM